MSALRNGNPDLQKEYLRTLRAMRVAATVCILFAAGWCWKQYAASGSAADVAEKMYQGGIDAMPEFSKLIISNRHVIVAGAALGGLVAMGWVWFGRSVPLVIYSGTGGVACYLLIAAAFDYAISLPVNYFEWFTAASSSVRG